MTDEPLQPRAAVDALRRYRARRHGLLESAVPLEIAEPPRFATEALRVNHLIKHVLLGRTEQWHHVLPFEDIAAARDECRDELCGEPGPVCAALSLRYEALVGGILVDACREGVGHAHAVRVESPDLVPEPEPALTSQRVYLWDRCRRLTAIATVGVRNGRPGTYRLRTAYRTPSKEASERRFAVLSLARARERARMRGEEILVVHDSTLGYPRPTEGGMGSGARQS